MTLWRANRIIVVGDAFARPILDALDAQTGSVGRVFGPPADLVRRDVSQGVKDGLIHHMPRRRARTISPPLRRSAWGRR
ncbi:hypothetical protein AB5I41_02955 [Sphingomonas sp. MMS24-JH45]